MALTCDYDDLGRSSDLSGDLRDDAIRAARIAASAARMLAIQAARDCGDTALPNGAVIPATGVIERAVRNALRRARNETDLLRYKAMLEAFFVSIPFLAVALVALYTPFPGHPNSNIGFGLGLMLAVGLAGLLVFGCRFALNYRRFTSSGYIEDSISADVTRLAGESWFPGERALHISSPTVGVMSVPYHAIGMVCVSDEGDGLYSVVIRSHSAYYMASIIPSGDGGRAAADDLAETIRIKTMASLVV
jgi:hypothetical protein